MIKKSSLKMKKKSKTKVIKKIAKILTQISSIDCGVLWVNLTWNGRDSESGNSWPYGVRHSEVFLYFELWWGTAVAGRASVRKSPFKVAVGFGTFFGFSSDRPIELARPSLKRVLTQCQHLHQYNYNMSTYRIFVQNDARF